MSTVSGRILAASPAISLTNADNNGGRTIFVSSTAELESALGGARANDTIKLASGSYTPITITNFNGANVTITSADPKNEAVITGLAIHNSSGIKVTDVTLSQSDPSAMYSFKVHDSSGITFDHVTVKGPALDATGLDNALMMIRNSTDVSVTNSEFSNARYGLSLLDTVGTEVKGNYFHDLRTDGVRGGGNNDLVISGNMFTDFKPAPGDHPDAIQLWTSNTKTASHDVTISDNIIVRGDGGAMQGIFIRNESGNLPYENLNISGNLVVGGMYHGLTVLGMASGSVTNNTVMGLPDQKSWILVNGPASVKVANNSSTMYNDPANADRSGNKLILSALDDGAGAAKSWLDGRPGLLKAWGGDAAAIMSLLDLKLNANSGTRDEDRWTTLTGGDGVDRLTVAAIGNTWIKAGGGDDLIYGASNGKHLFEGGGGNDTYFVKSADDVIVEYANGGSDTIVAYVDVTMADNVENLKTGVNGVLAIGNDLDNRMTGSAGADVFHGMDGDDAISLMEGNDVAYGGEGVDNITGGLGDDTIYGDAGDDILKGSEGNDVLDGGAGNDLLEGGAGIDVFTGGAGADEFRFRPGDLEPGKTEVITDFQRGLDIVSLGLIDANSKTAANDKFKFIGTEGFHKVAGELHYTVSGGDAFVSGDVNGDGVADFTIKLKNIAVLSASDFVL